MKILMVCLGNICRSPMAEGIMQVLLEDQQIPGTVDSAGISDFHQGESPDKRAINISREFGVDISRQTSRPFIESDLTDFDYIFTMDDQVHRWILDRYTGHPDIKKVHLFLRFAGNERQTGANVPDPYYGGVMEFRKVFGILEKGCEQALQRISEANQL